MGAAQGLVAKGKLPIGIQTFREIREEGYYYVDKTAHIGQLAEKGKHYFLSRPRRFGKSLLLDTIKELFEGSEALFRELAIHGQWDWGVRHPVLRLSFGSGEFKQPGELQARFREMLRPIGDSVGVGLESSTAAGCFAAVINALRERNGRRVVVLVDEYDKPILDALDAPEIARANRDFLRGVYSVVKDRDEDIEFTLLTGVSKFSRAFSRGARGVNPSHEKVSLFSGMNNLEDITLDPSYSAICGYREQDLIDVFALELEGLDLKEVRRWYNGYNWRGEEKVYNPFDILLLFRQREFKAHWFETGSPKFLIDTLLRRGVPTLDLDGMVGSEALLSAFDVDEMSVEALLFQTGYLTIVGEDAEDGLVQYRLGYPNREVRRSLNERLLMALLPDASRRLAQRASLRKLLAADDFAGLEALLRSVFAAIPHQWHTRNDIRGYEGYYASVVYSYFASQGLELVAEDSASGGRADMTVRHGQSVYVFEFKLADRGHSGTALAQIKDKGYAEKYRQPGRPIHLIGVEFSAEERNIAAFEVERAA